MDIHSAESGLRVFFHHSFSCTTRSQKLTWHLIWYFARRIVTTKSRRHGNLDRPWFGDQLWQFLKVNVCNLKTLALIGRPLWTHNTRLTGMCSSRQIAALKKKKLGWPKNCKTWQNDVGSWVLVILFPFRSRCFIVLSAPFSDVATCPSWFWLTKDKK